MTSTSLGDRIRKTTLTKFTNNDINRVITCWNDFIAQKKLHRYLDGENKQILQTADCFVTGLTAQPFHNVRNFNWIQGLEDNYKMILQELINYESKQRKLKIADIKASSEGHNSDLLQIITAKPTGEGLEGDGNWLGPRDTSGRYDLCCILY